MARMLAVDDDESVCKMIAVCLGNAGHTVTTCTDGAEAIRSILAQIPDLVLLDLRMPYIDGFELLRALKGDPLTQEIPVIVVSVLNDINILGRVAALRANSFIRKPIRGEELLDSVERVLESCATRRSNRLSHLPPLDSRRDRRLLTTNRATSVR